jgi:hypothetical protein
VPRDTQELVGAERLRHEHRATLRLGRAHASTLTALALTVNVATTSHAVIREPCCGSVASRAAGPTQLPPEAWSLCVAGTSVHTHVTLATQR